MRSEEEIKKQIEWERNRMKTAVELGCKSIMFQCEGSLWALGWVLNEQKEGAK